METATEIAAMTQASMEPTPYTDSERLDQVYSQLKVLTESHNRILALLESLESQFGPVIQGMSNGPIGKLMGL